MIKRMREQAEKGDGGGEKGEEPGNRTIGREIPRYPAAQCFTGVTREGDIN